MPTNKRLVRKCPPGTRTSVSLSLEEEEPPWRAASTEISSKRLDVEQWLDGSGSSRIERKKQLRKKQQQQRPDQVPISADEETVSTFGDSSRQDEQSYDSELPFSRIDAYVPKKSRYQDILKGTRSARPWEAKPSSDDGSRSSHRSAESSLRFSERMNRDPAPSPSPSFEDDNDKDQAATDMPETTETADSIDANAADTADDPQSETDQLMTTLSAEEVSKFVSARAAKLHPWEADASTTSPVPSLATTDTEFSVSGILEQASISRNKSTASSTAGSASSWREVNKDSDLTDVPALPRTESTQVAARIKSRSAATRAAEMLPSARVIAERIRSPEVEKLLNLRKDPAYLHAVQAGYLWQSLVGGQVRLPPAWFQGGQRGPPMGLSIRGDVDSGTGTLPAWQYYGCHGVANDERLLKVVPHRTSPGRLLLHVIVVSPDSNRQVQHIAVGCLDPSASGVRRTDAPDPNLRHHRWLWWAVLRPSSEDRQSSRPSSVSVLLNARLLQSSSTAHLTVAQHYYPCKYPLGPKRRVNNANMRAVYGEEPPLHTVVMEESELYQRLLPMSTTLEDDNECIAMRLLQEFVFRARVQVIHC